MNWRSERVRENRRQIYQMKDKEVKRRVQADKRGALEKVEEEAQRAVYQNNLKDLYTKTKLLSGCPQEAKHWNTDERW